MTPGEERLEREQSQRKETKATHDGNGKSTARLSMGTEPEKKRKARGVKTGRGESEGLEIEELRLLVNSAATKS